MQGAAAHGHAAPYFFLLLCPPTLRRASSAFLQGFDITPDLRRMCPSLTLQQIYKLTEHHHDDWITGGQV